MYCIKRLHSNLRPWDKGTSVLPLCYCCRPGYITLVITVIDTRDSSFFFTIIKIPARILHDFGLKYNLKVIHLVIIILIKCMNWSLNCRPKIPTGSTTISWLSSPTSTKTAWPARTMTSSEDRQIRAKYIGQAILGERVCPIKKKKTLNSIQI
jgi:hypothetical protein